MKSQRKKRRKKFARIIVKQREIGGGPYEARIFMGGHSVASNLASDPDRALAAVVCNQASRLGLSIEMEGLKFF